MFTITFICTGNTCRSAMAEGICRTLIEKRGITDTECRSCGLAAFTGDEVSRNAVIAAKKYSADISSHRAKALNPYILEESSLIVCMTERHKSALMSAKPTCRVIVPDPEINDPWGGTVEVYEKCADELYGYINKLLDAVTANIVPMEEKHIKSLALIEKECFSAPWSENSLREELRNETAHFLTAESGDKVLGYIGVHEVCGEAYIANLAVSGEYRRMGTGEKLALRAAEDAEKRKCEFISLEVRKSNLPAIELYKKQGYNVAGERKSFYTAPQEDALIMTKILKEEK